MPIGKWARLQKEKDLAHLMVSYHRVRQWMIPFLQAHHEKLNMLFVEHFGVSDTYISILRKKVQIAQLKVQKIVTGDRSYNLNIKILAQELESMEKRYSGQMDFYELKTGMEKAGGYVINENEMSVIEFYTKLNLLNNSNGR